MRARITSRDGYVIVRAISSSTIRCSRSTTTFNGAFLSFDCFEGLILRRRFAYECVRNGTANVFMFVDVNRPWRHAKVTDQRTCIDFAECMRDLVDEHYPKAERIRVVVDNLSTHTRAALYQRFAPAEAHRILSRIEFHDTPKHASWLNMVEIEIGVMVRQCLSRRIAERTTLVSEIAQWERRRNRDRAGIDWMFTVERARENSAASTLDMRGGLRTVRSSRGMNRSDPLWAGTSWITAH